jgi:uncharacterized protein (DUF169 family)
MDVKYCDNCGDKIDNPYSNPRIKITVDDIGDYKMDKIYYPDLCQICLVALLNSIYPYLPKIKEDWDKYKSGKTKK